MTADTDEKRVSPRKHRRAWLADRKRRRLLRPLPFVEGGGNCMSVSADPETAKSIFRGYLDSGADALYLTECSDFDGQKVADQHAPDVWEVVQFGEVHSPESGSLAAIRKARADVTDQELVSGTPAVPGFRPRSIVHVDLVIDQGTKHQWIHPGNAGHAPTKKAPAARLAFMEKLREQDGTKAGDFNLVERAVLRILDRCSVRGFGVIHVAVPRWIPVGRTVKIPREDLGSGRRRADHDGTLRTLWPRRRRPFTKEKP